MQGRGTGGGYATRNCVWVVCVFVFLYVMWFLFVVTISIDLDSLRALRIEFCTLYSSKMEGNRLLDYVYVCSRGVCCVFGTVFLYF